MQMVAIVLAALVALLHLYFLVLEMFFWTKPLGRKAFGLDKDFAESKGYGTSWAAQAEFASFMAKGDADMGVVMKAAGLAK